MLRLWTIALAALAFSAPVARAQPAPAGQADAPQRDEAAARSAFELGRSAYDRGRFTEALAQFDRAYALSPHPKLLFNIARAAEADGQSARAIEAYRAYLSAIPDADNREFVEARLAKLESGAAPAPAPAAAAPAVANDSVVVPSPEAAARTEAAPAPALVPTSSSSDRDTLEPARPFWKRGWFWGVVGVVVAGAVTTGIVLAIDHDPKPVKADEHILTLGAR